MSVETKFTVGLNETKFIEILEELVADGKAEFLGANSNFRTYRVAGTITEEDLNCIPD